MFLTLALAVACGLLFGVIVLAFWPYTLVIGFGLLALGLSFYQPIARAISGYLGLGNESLDAANLYSLFVGGFALVILGRYAWEGRRKR